MSAITQNEGSNYKRERGGGETEKKENENKNETRVEEKTMGRSYQKEEEMKKKRQ